VPASRSRSARPKTLKLAELRRRVVAAQGFAADPKLASSTAAVAKAIRRLSCVQLDSISTVERSHRIVLSARIGAYPREAETALLERGKVFEYWAHEACLVPIEDYVLFRFRMRERRIHHWFGPVIDRDPKLAEQVLGTIRERGALGSRHFEGQGGGGMWNWKPAKKMLDALWTAGELVISGREAFQRRYELPERIVPKPLLEAPIPSEPDFLRALIIRAVTARGALTAKGIMEHYRLRGGVSRIRPHLSALVGEGVLEELAVDDGGAPVFVPAGTRTAAVPEELAVLLSPFDNLLWDRAFVTRVFEFDHLIEVYKPQPQRRFGYYVLPLLAGDRLVGRVDVKSDRAEGVLRLKAFHPEGRPTAPERRRLDEALDRAADALARRIGLERVAR
jgi:uncharacterized protein YcaQ